MNCEIKANEYVPCVFQRCRHHSQWRRRGLPCDALADSWWLWLWSWSWQWTLLLTTLMSFFLEAVAARRAILQTLFSCSRKKTWLDSFSNSLEWQSITLLFDARHVVKLAKHFPTINHVLLGLWVHVLWPYISCGGLTSDSSLDIIMATDSTVGSGDDGTDTDGKTAQMIAKKSSSASSEVMPHVTSLTCACVPTAHDLARISK